MNTLPNTTNTTAASLLSNMTVDADGRTTLKLNDSITIIQHPRINHLHKVCGEGERIWQSQRVDTLTDGVITHSEEGLFWGHGNGKISRVSFRQISTNQQTN